MIQYISASRLGTGSQLARRAAAAAALLFVFGDAGAQVSAPPRATADYVNAVGFGFSHGEIRGKKADFWGWSLDYSSMINHRWIAGLALTWDKETEQFIDRPDKTVRTYALIGSISYNLTQNFSLTSGLAQNIADDDNATGTMKIKAGDLSTGLSLGYSVPLSPRNTLGTSLGYEYNLSENETSISIDVMVGWSF